MSLVVGGIDCYTRFVAHPITVDCMLHYVVHLRFSFPPFCPAKVIVRRGRRRTGRSGMLSEFWLPVKISSVFFNVCSEEGPRMMYVLRYSDQFQKIIFLF
jgi:hypothetical protein